MRLPNDPTKYTARFKYIEIGRFLPGKNRVTRETLYEGVNKPKKPVMLDVSELEDYAKRHDNLGIYTSIFQYDSKDLHESASLGPVYFDIDTQDVEGDNALDIPRIEAYRLVQALLEYVPESAIRLYFSGGKGFHIECEPIALGIGPADDTPAISRAIAHKFTEDLALTTLDSRVYDRRRMWRAPNSRHQRTGLFKVECMSLRRDGVNIETIVKYAEKPQKIEVPEQVFDAKANKWYREFIYQMEADLIERKENQQNLLERFLNEGSGYLKKYNGERVFDAFILMQNCSAVRNLVKRAREEHFLDHYERLFLCSLLTYSEPAIEFLHQVLSMCEDYNFEISNAHIEDWIKRREYDIGGRPFTCKKAKEVGIMCSDCDKMKPRKKVMRLESGHYLETEEYSLPSPIRHVYHTRRD